MIQKAHVTKNMLFCFFVVLFVIIFFLSGMITKRIFGHLESQQSS